MLSQNTGLTRNKPNTCSANTGVQAYYVPRSNPDGIAVTLSCIKPEQVNSLFFFFRVLLHSLFHLVDILRNHQLRWTKLGTILF
jgi:hypothetical protein